MAHSSGEERTEDFADRDADCFDCSRGGFSQQMLELGEDLFDRVQVGRVFWQEEELGAGGADERPHRLAFVTTEIVHDDDVTLAQRGQEDLLDLGPKALTTATQNRRNHPLAKINRIRFAHPCWPPSQPAR